MSPHEYPSIFQTIGAKLDAINPIAAGIDWKTFANIRYHFVSAVRKSRLLPGLNAGPGCSKDPLAPAWAALTAQLRDQRARFGSSRLAHWASRRGIAPDQVNDQVIESFTAELRNGSLRRGQNRLHRVTTTIWNEIAARLPELNIRPVSVPPSRRRYTRIDKSLVPATFRHDLEKYVAWCAVTDEFADDARGKAFKPGTCQILRGQIDAAFTALVNSGIDPPSIQSLADLVSVEAVRNILRHRYEAVGRRRDNSYNIGMATALVHIARDWVKADPHTLTKLKRFASKVRPRSTGDMTDKNKRLLRQFDDPDVVQRLLKLPELLWLEVKSPKKPTRSTLARAQAAIAIACLTYMPLRLVNLTALTFDVHLFLHDGARAVSTLEIPAAEVKNERAIAFDIPPHIAKMLIEYRDNIAPKLIGHRPARVFVNRDGTPKTFQTVRYLITTYLAQRAGITLNPHAFRHLSGKLLLDELPGGHARLKDLLGHSRIETTIRHYAGIRTRQAGQHHMQLLDKARTYQPTPRRRTGRSRPVAKQSKKALPPTAKPLKED
jgi:integrase